ncbi:MAG: low molecular weight protein-tyrosine phosphatase [Cryptosporangiaceae bacterium]|nr:low molecular weight protein-tyrosine phosphatase [Cryptosporangiaceae bacterium]
MRPFSVLHVCMGNICRSPMAERLLAARLRDALGPVADELVRSHGAGTGDWHIGDGMNPPAARQVLARGGSTEGFAARWLEPPLIAESDLILTATAEQWEHVVTLAPEAAPRTFVLGEFARLLAAVDTADLPRYGPEVAAVADRGRALVAAVHAARGGEPPVPEDDLEDPWGRGEAFFSRTADQVEDAIKPLVDALTG